MSHESAPRDQPQPRGEYDITHRQVFGKWATEDPRPRGYEGFGPGINLATNESVFGSSDSAATQTPPESDPGAPQTWDSVIERVYRDIGARRPQSR